MEDSDKIIQIILTRQDSLKTSTFFDRTKNIIVFIEMSLIIYLLNNTNTNFLHGKCTITMYASNLLFLCCSDDNNSKNIKKDFAYREFHWKLYIRLLTEKNKYSFRKSNPAICPALAIAANAQIIMSLIPRRTLSFTKSIFSLFFILPIFDVRIF